MNLLQLSAGSKRDRAVYRSALVAKIKSLRSGHMAPPAARLSPRALLIWRQRSDLQEVFNLEDQSGRVGLFWWYLLHAHRELGLDADDGDATVSPEVNRPIPRLPKHGFTSITWLMREMYRRAGMRFPPLRSRDGQEQILAWFFTTALMEGRLGAFLTKGQADGLRDLHPDWRNVQRVLVLIWQNNDQIRDRFLRPDDPEFLRWCRDEGARDFPILSHPLVAFAHAWRPPNQVSGRFGVNLIGHAFHRSGLSEDMRAAALSLEQAKIPFAVHNAGGGGPIPDEDLDLSANASQDLPFDVNLFCFTGISTVTAVLANPDLSLDRRYSIGMWPWELPEWPQFWQHSYRYVDELWAASRFTYDAYCRSSPIPVRHVPMAVSVDATEGAMRGDFGLPEDRFLFSFAFDGLSSFARKNPAACIAAFKRAFPDTDHAVGLVIKGMRTQGTDAWTQVCGLAEGDPRIFMITESLSRGRLLDLYRAVDCFVSLHRSEGFGRNIAETMLLGKPAIVSAHSGNMDFTEHSTAALVPVRLVPLEDGAYPFGDGQIWAEADINAAAAHMRRLFEDPDWRKSIAKAGKAKITHLYSPAVVGKRWAEILHEISR